MDNLYDAPTQTAPDDASMPEDEMHGDQQSSEQTVLANKELCPDCRPGDKLIVEVVKDHGKEIELRYVGKEGGEDDGQMPEGEPEQEPDMADSMMA